MPNSGAVCFKINFIRLSIPRGAYNWQTAVKIDASNGRLANALPSRASLIAVKPESYRRASDYPKYRAGPIEKKIHLSRMRKMSSELRP